MRGPIDDHRHITIGTTFMESDIADLHRQADAIAVIEVVGNKPRPGTAQMDVNWVGLTHCYVLRNLG
jgi:hypothetical protein